jgi:hypothetical protein
LYKEDFEKFAEGLNEVVDFIKSNNGAVKQLSIMMPVLKKRKASLMLSLRI